MKTTVSALFDNAMDAQNAVRELTNNGVRRDDISLIASDAAGEYARYHGQEIPADDTLEGAAGGALLGGLGGLLVGLAALAIPGVGPIVAAGPIATALAGAGIGAVTGGILGALIDLGVTEEDASYYAEGVRRGGTLVTAHVDDSMANRVASILDRYNPVDLETRSSLWREEGWSGYDPDARPYTFEEIERERMRY
jgi:uncharacterized membrane protein